MVDQTPIHDIPLAEALSSRYLAYALSTITARSLPDVRDGLKPVHRRILYAMRQLKLDPRSGFKKSARIVGDVIGKFHPHGDQSVYDALVRLAQDFAQRYPLVDGQGNFGNVDGDNAAAMRYTETRLSRVAELLLQDIDQDTVDFRETYDGEDREPMVLPAAFPNLLANGTSGIAVGMATAIPPHNIGEICDALLHLIKAPKARIETLVEHISGPDFPTGGILVEPADAIVQAYASGKGSFRLRARWTQESLDRGQWQIVVTEIPYQVAKSRLIEKLAELVVERKLPWLADVRDESAEDVRIVLEPKSRTVDPEQLMEALFRQTDLEVRVPLNMTVLAGGKVPGVKNLREVLQAYLDHRHDILLRKSRHRLAEIERRLEILDGFLVAFLNLDKIIRIIREEDEPKVKLCRAFRLSDVQAEAILNMRLRQLRRLEEAEIRGEHAALTAEGKRLRALLKDEKARWQVVATEIAEIKREFGPKTALGRRRTALGQAPKVAELKVEAMVEREPVTVICSAKGWIRAMRGHVADDGKAIYKEGDRGRFWLHAETTDKLMLFATSGRFFTLQADRLPRGRGQGDPVKLLVDLGEDEDIVALFVHRPGRKLLVAATDGKGFVVEEDQVVAQTRSGKQILNLGADAEAKVCVPAEGDTVACVGDNHKLLLFPLSDVPTMARGRGVALQKYRDGGLSDAKVFAKAGGLSWRLGDRVRTETDLDPWFGRRASAGRLPPRGFSKANRFEV